MEMTLEFGQFVKRRRKELDLTQQALAEELGYSVDTIKKIEAGTLRPSRQLAELLAQALDVPPAERPAFVRSARMPNVPLPDMSWEASPSVTAESTETAVSPLSPGPPNGATVANIPAPADGATVTPQLYRVLTDSLKLQIDLADKPQPLPLQPLPLQPLPLQQEPTNPYKGLRAFQEADAPDFFGREALIGRLCARIGEEGELSRFLAVVGSSGAGKSSLVRAGLIPMLRRGALPGGANPLVVNVIPGAHPFEELEAGLLRVAANPPGSLMEQLRTDERGLVRAVKRALPDDEKSELVLVIDQFEELFTLVADEGVRADFIDSLFVAVGEVRSRLRVVVTLRADYYDRPLLYLPATELFNQRTELVGPLSEGEMYRAITAPAQHVGLELERGLADTILQDLAEQPGTLPLLQYTLTELYERRTGRVLTLTAYRASGGVFGALAGRAENLYSGLTEQEQSEARQLFLRLATPGAGVEDTRRRVLRSELASASQDEAALERVLELFGRYRMLTFDRDPLSGGPTVEVAHEALLGAWERLRAWLADSRERLQTERRLMLLSDEWQASGQDTSFLASGARLAQFSGLAEEAGRPDALALTSEEQLYLAASLARENQSRQEEQARQQKELALQKRAASRLKVLVGGLALFLLVAVGLSLFAFDRQRHSEALRLAAEANVLLQARGSNSPLIALLAIRSLRTQYTHEGDAMLNRAATLAYPRMQFTVAGGRVGGSTFSPDGQHVLSVSGQTLRLWDAQTAQPERVITYTGTTITGTTIITGIHTARFSPDGHYVLAGSNDNKAYLLDPLTGQEVRQFKGHTDPVLQVAYSPDGRFVLTGSVDKTARLWDAQTAQQVLTFTGHTNILIAVAFSPDGKQVLTGSWDGTARLWDAATGQEVLKFDINTDPDALNVKLLRGAIFSPDGKYVLTSNDSDENSARLWDAQTGKQVQQFKGGHTNGVRSMAFAPDGKTLLTGSYDHSVKLWDVASARELRTFAGHTDQVGKIDFSPDGQSFVTTGSDGIALLWDVADPPSASAFTGHGAPVLTVLFTPDGKQVLTSGDDGKARLWDAQTHAEVQRFDGYAESSSNAFSPDGKSLLTSSGGPVARLWDTQTGAAVISYTSATTKTKIYGVVFAPDGKGVLTIEDSAFRLLDVQTGHEIQSFAALPLTNYDVFGFSPDGTLALASSVSDHPVRIWDIKAGLDIHKLVGHNNVIQSAVFSPDGKQVLAANLDSMAWLWDAQTGQLVRQFVGHTAGVMGVAFSQDGRYVLTGSQDTTARLWDAQSGREVRRFGGHTDQVNGVAFSPNGRQIATTSQDGTARLWDVDYQDSISALCSRLVRDFTDEERAQYNIAGNEPTCPQP